MLSTNLKPALKLGDKNLWRRILHDLRNLLKSVSTEEPSLICTKNFDSLESKLSTVHLSDFFLNFSAYYDERTMVHLALAGVLRTEDQHDQSALLIILYFSIVCRILLYTEKRFHVCPFQSSIVLLPCETSVIALCSFSISFCFVRGRPSTFFCPFYQA